MNKLVSALVYKKGKVAVLDHVKIQCWSIPVGHQEKGETSLESITRELHEELGIKVVEAHRMCQSDLMYRDGIRRRNFRSTVFQVTHYTGIPINKERSKHVVLIWRTLRELEHMCPLSEVTKQALSLISKEGQL